MRITRLYMKNFIALNVAQQKREIEIKFPEDKVINLLYGDMGSGKTFILGHCQPWHTFGTLDVRNGDPQIMDEENGVKIIEFKDEDDYWVIKHEWIWNKTTHSHTSKHFFCKNGTELNVNGNLNTFNDLVKLDFGIDQDYLKMIRIGDNVSNMPSMKSTERKTFIASKLEESQFWLILYKKLTLELRNLNSQAKFVLNNLGKKSFKDMDIMKDELNDMKDDLKDAIREDTELVQRINHNKGILSAMLDGKSLDHYLSDMDKNEEVVNSLMQTINTLKKQKEKATSLTLEEVSKKIGSLEAKRDSCAATLDAITARYDSVVKEIEELSHQIKMKDNSDQWEVLKDSVIKLQIKIDQLGSEVKEYPYDFSHQNLLEYSSMVDSIDSDINILKGYNMDDVIYIIKHGKSAIQDATRRLDNLRYKASLLGTHMNNLQYAGTYREPYRLFLPPFCPTKDCPFYQTHPSIIAKDIKKTELEANLNRKQSELIEVQNQIARFEAYSYISTVVSRVKNQWGVVSKPLSKMKLLLEPRLELVIGKNREWVDHGLLVRYIELAQKRTELFTLRERLLSAKDQMNQMELSNPVTMQERLAHLYETKESLLHDSQYTSDQLKETKAELQKWDDNYLIVSKKEDLLESLENAENQYNTLCIEYLKMEKTYRECQEIVSQIGILETKELGTKAVVNNLNDRIIRQQMELERLQTSMEQYNDIMEKIRIYQLISESTSPKSGIPMDIVEMYMNECLDTINDLIAGIFDDDLEIESFHPTEDAFLIPYNRSGHIIDDISKASQGEKSIIGISISFAMMENTMTRMRYNIPLLDEPDGALHAQDRNRFFLMLMKHMKKIESDQVIIISHNQTFEGYPMHIILTSDEDYKTTELQTVTRV